jgi:MFS family permease
VFTLQGRLLSFGVLLIVWLAFLFSFVDRLAWPPIIPMAVKDMGMTAVQAGAYMTAFYTGYVLTQLPGGLLTDRWGYRKVLLASFLIMGTFTLSMGLVHSYAEGWIMRFLAGLGSGAVFSACIRAIFAWFPGKGRATAMGFFMTASSLGVSVVNLFVPALAQTYGWRTSFLAAGLLPLIGWVLALPLLKENKTAVPHMHLPGAARFWQDVMALLHNRNFLLTACSGFCAMWATWGTATWANTYLNKGLHLSVVQAGLMMSVYGMAALFCKPLIGIVSDLTGVKRKTILFWALLLFGPILLWFGANRSSALLYILAPMLGIAAYVYSPVMNTFIGELVDERLVGTASGLVNAIWQLGSLLSPLVVGAVIDRTHNYFTAFATLAGGPFLAAFLMLWVKERENPSTDQ